MPEEQYQLIFRGHALDDYEISSVKESFSKFFNVSADKADAYFNGEPRVVSTNLDRETASRYADVLAKNGIAMFVEAMAPVTSDTDKREVDTDLGFVPSKMGRVWRGIKPTTVWQYAAWSVLLCLLAIRGVFAVLNMQSEGVLQSHYLAEARQFCIDDIACAVLVEQQFQACYLKSGISNYLNSSGHKAVLARRTLEDSFYTCFNDSDGDALFYYSPKK